jgi:multidrug efflux system membrane fusion protein
VNPVAKPPDPAAVLKPKRIVGSIQQGPNDAYVWVIGPDGTAQIRPVTVGQISDGQALIDSGLQANETVVTAGQYRLAPGALVQQLHGKAAQDPSLNSAVEQALP